MFNLLIGSLPTIFVGSAVAILLIGVSFKMYRDKKNGKSSCGCKCADCPSAGICHTK